MPSKPKKHGTIAVVSGELARYSAFPRHLVRIDRPEGTTLDWAMTADIAAARNILVRNFLKTDGAWLWFIDDDMVFESDVLMRLLACNAPIVQPLVLMRTSPHKPVLYTGPNAITGLYEQNALTNEMKMVPVDACGTGGMLIRREVFEQIADPWFEVGKVVTDSLGEDLAFCQKAKQLNLGIFVDTTTPVGHITPVEIWPLRDPNDPDRKWVTEIRFDSQHSLLIEAAS